LLQQGRIASKKTDNRSMAAVAQKFFLQRDGYFGKNTSGGIHGFFLLIWWCHSGFSIKAHVEQLKEGGNNKS